MATIVSASDLIVGVELALGHHAIDQPQLERPPGRDGRAGQSISMAALAGIARTRGIIGVVQNSRS